MIADISLVNRSAGCVEARRVRRNANTGGYIEYNVSRNHDTIFVVRALIFTVSRRCSYLVYHLITVALSIISNNVLMFY